MIRFVMINTTLKSFNFNEYTNELIEKVKLNLDAKDVEFYSNKDRTRKCSLLVNGKQFFVNFTNIVTRGSIQLKIDISMQVQSTSDKDLHDLKITIKDLLIEGWEQCVWLEDQQSEALAEELYKDIHSVENSLRRLINTVLFYKLGGHWWETYMPTHLTKKYNQRNDPYRDRAPSFKNIHTNLLSIDTGDLVSILSFKTYKLKDPNIFKTTPVVYIHGFAEPESHLQRKQQLNRFKYLMNDLINDPKSVEQHQSNLITVMQEQMEVDIDFWHDYFSPWFSCDFSQFEGKWKNFSTDRNHVAHNKLIDFKLHHKFKKSMGDLLDIITVAEDKFSQHLEDEVNSYLDELEESQDAESYLRELHFKELMEEEAGITILDEDAIIELLQEHINHTFESIEQEIYYRSDFEVSYTQPTLTMEHRMFIVSHSVTKRIIAVDVEPYIDYSEGKTSSVNFLLYYNDECQETFEISYTNGQAEFNEEQSYYMPMVQEELNITALDELKTHILKLVEEKMPEVSEEDLSYNPCEKCDIYAVNISLVSLENEYELGTCFNCGHKNPVGMCLKCDAVLESSEEGLCESCLDYIDKQ